MGYFVEHSRTASFGVPTLDQVYYEYYDTVARMLVAGDNLRPLRGFRPLLYPLFLAALYKTGGAWGIHLAIVAQHLLGVATGVIVALQGARLFQHRLCGLAGGGRHDSPAGAPHLLRPALRRHGGTLGARGIRQRGARGGPDGEKNLADVLE